MPRKSSEKPRTPRNLMERAKTIFNFINEQTEPFPKSELQKIGFNPSSAENWVRLIEYIQSQPRIRVTQMGSSTFIEKISVAVSYVLVLNVLLFSR